MWFDVRYWGDSVAKLLLSLVIDRDSVVLRQSPVEAGDDGSAGAGSVSVFLRFSSRCGGATRPSCAPGDEPIDWPERREASRAVREYLAALDAAHSEEESSGGCGGGSSHGGGKPAKQVSLTDPQAAWVGRKGVDPFFAYDENYLIDKKAGVIVDAEGTRANRSEEIAVTEIMVERVEHRFGLLTDW